MRDGLATVSLDVPRDSLYAELDDVDPLNPNPETVQSNWAKAVNTSIVSEHISIVDGSFDVTLNFDAWPMNETLYIKVYAANSREDAYGFVIAP